MTLETERLQIRLPSTSDVAFFYKLMNTDMWIKHIGDRGINSMEKAVEYIESLKSKYHSVGFTLYVITQSKTPIGLCGLLKRDYLDHPDLGFALLPDFMGNGYIQEAATSILNDVFQNQEFSKILAITSPNNMASQSTLERLGFISQGIIHTPEHEEVLLYEKQKK
ncbi:GNAT family N-acetyltransferase [Ekhidna sp.]|jgi:ribosomal-protein-alanine N-acetyltransferase|uniref:GNAT family N-acetyltransferase n=1 Tax=Ekhidna sp. TaxID=2608089 RepID=UPI0032F00AC1